jgi:hypothetical protein
MSNIQCPSCGSTDVTSKQVPGSMPMPYGPDATFVETLHTCNVCGVSADFTGGNDAIVKQALERSASVSAAAILEDLAEAGITQAHFERALRLPARTAARWKDGGVSAAPLALLRLVRTYPWLLDIADANFEPTEAARAVLRAAAELFFADVPRQAVTSATLAYMRTETHAVMAAGVQFETQTEPTNVEILPLAHAALAAG